MLGRPCTNNTPRVNVAEGIRKNIFFLHNLPCKIAVNDDIYRFSVQIFNCKLLVRIVMFLLLLYGMILQK